MNVNEILFQQLKENFAEKNEIIEYTKKNAMYYSIAYLLDIDVKKQFYYKTNCLRYRTYIRSFLEIKAMFEKFKLNYLVFKGIVLANSIYDTPTKRYVGDLDIYVDREGYPIALMELVKLGYVFRDSTTFYNEHHIVMIKDNVTIELHKNIFNPHMGINEIYLRENTTNIQLEGQEVRTFNVNASFLHLVYHLYMDTWLVWNDTCSFIATGCFPKAFRFYYRAYEIALFSEKYSSVIDWGEIKRDIEKQNFRVIFKKMIMDIVEVFPNVFPIDLLELIYQKDYVEDSRDSLCEHLYRPIEVNSILRIT